MIPINHFIDRRQFLSHTASGFGSVALASLLARDGLLGAQEKVRESAAGKNPITPVIDPGNPNAPRLPHFEPRAKQVLMIFCSGAVSQIDTFDYKPELIKHHGKPMPGGENLITFQGQQGNLTRSPWEFKPRGQSGKMISDLVPKLGDLADEMCFLHAMTGKTNTHGPGENFMCTGFTLDGFPSAGSWMTYALGSAADDLPAYVAIPDVRGKPQSSGNCWGPGFLPAAFQGTDFNAVNPVRNLAVPGGITTRTDAATRAFLQRQNHRHLAGIPGEPAHILRDYGVDESGSKIKDLRASYGRNCILARRLIEKGVRFVQLFNGAYQTGGEGVSNWDGHKALEKQYNIHGPVLDQPTAALLKDMKTRGLLEDTLVVFATEFGRMPTFQKGASGRDHNPDGFTAWMAGAGVKTPFTYGATDAFGHKAVEKVTTVYDFYATILHILGLDHERLSFYHNGIERRLTDVHGHVIKEILS